MRKLSVAVGLSLALLAARPAAAEEFTSYYDGAQSDGYGVTFTVGNPSPYCPEAYAPDPYAVSAPAYIPAPVVVYPPPPVVVYQPPVIYRSIVIHRPIVERRVIVRQVVRQPVVVKQRVVVKEPVVVKRHPVKQDVVVPNRPFDRPGGHRSAFPPGLQRIGQRR
jgi:hypothetical protein